MDQEAGSCGAICPTRNDHILCVFMRFQSPNFSKVNYWILLFINTYVFLFILDVTQCGEAHRITGMESSSRAFNVSFRSIITIFYFSITRLIKLLILFVYSIFTSSRASSCYFRYDRRACIKVRELKHFHIKTVRRSGPYFEHVECVMEDEEYQLPHKSIKPLTSLPVHGLSRWISSTVHTFLMHIWKMNYHKLINCTVGCNEVSVEDIVRFSHRNLCWYSSHTILWRSIKYTQTITCTFGGESWFRSRGNDDLYWRVWAHGYYSVQPSFPN